MTFSQEWEAAFRANTHLSLWPWTDLVSYVHRYAKPASGQRVLELGCGAGANIPFFLKLETDYHSVEGSATIVTMVHEHYPKLRDKVAVGDFTRGIPFDGAFDLVVDRAATPHNTIEAIRNTIATVFSRLRSGAKFVGIDWFSRAHEDAEKGTRIDDYTRRDLASRNFRDLGIVHFFDQEHLAELLTSTGFAIERLEHKLHEVRVPVESERFASWNFVARKP